MIKENGKVIEARDGEALVIVSRSSACEGCSAKGACHTLGGGMDSRVKVENPLGAVEGDQVEIGINESSLVMASIIVYMLPLIALFAGAGLGGLLYEYLGILSKGGMSAIMGLLFLVLGFVIIRLFDPVLEKKENIRPRIIRIIRGGG